MDSPLTERGMQQATKLGHLLENCGIEALYCSSLPRALATASVLGRYLGLEPRPSDALRECGWGQWEGRPWANLKKDFPELMKRREEDIMAFRAPGGESYEEVERRMWGFFEPLMQKNSGRTIALVGHGMMNRLLVRRLLGLSVEEMRSIRQGNGEVYHLLPEGEGYRLRMICEG